MQKEMLDDNEALFESIMIRIPKLDRHAPRKHYKKGHLGLKKRLGAWDVTLQSVLDKFGDYPRCYLTGLPCYLDNPHSYELEHVKPKSKGGPSTLDNLQFVNPMVNKMKHNFELEEFIEMCRLVAKKWQ